MASGGITGTIGDAAKAAKVIKQIAKQKAKREAAKSGRDAIDPKKEKDIDDRFNGGEKAVDSAGDLAQDFGGKVPWASTAKNPEGALNATAHWTKHGKEFPEISSAKGYVEKATGFTKEPPAGTLSRPSRNGDTVLYHPDSNTLVMHTPEKLPTTMYKPDPARHKYGSNLDFFNNHNF